jgi:hypothetical protein
MFKAKQVRITLSGPALLKSFQSLCGAGFTWFQ